MLGSTKKNVDSGNRCGRERFSCVPHVPMANLENGSCGANGSKATVDRTSSSSRRRVPFRQRVNKTTSVVITVTFVLIFAFIIALEILFMDESNHFKLQVKIPDMEVSNVIEDGGTAIETMVNTHSESPLDAKIVLQINDRKPYLPLSNRPSSHISDEVTSPVNNNVDTKRIILSHLEPETVVRDVKTTRTRALRQETLLLKEPPSHASSAVHIQKTPDSLDWDTVHEHNLKATKGDWQPVTGARNKFYVYSAYLDIRQGSFIRVIAATRTRGSDKVSCVYWYKAKDKKEPLIVPANNKAIRENWNLKYSAMFILCPLFVYSLGRKVPVPDEVSIVVTHIIRESNRELHSMAPVGNRLRVLNHNASLGTSVNSVSGFAVCVKPLHYQYNRAMQLVEFIELNRILGVQHFTFYNHTIGPEVDCVLREYVQQGLVTLLPWQLDMATQKEIRTEGLFAAINDCLYRNMYKYNYLLMIDFDEYIVPHRNTTLDAVLQELYKKVDKVKAASFSFMNSFFYLQWPNDTNARDVPPLVTLQKTKRRAKFHPHKQRSKCIIVPRYVVEMGNHFVWEFLPGKGAVNAPPDVAFLHHYRVCEFGGNDCIKTQSVTDRTVYRYKTDLVQKVEQRLHKSRTDGPIECRDLTNKTQLKR